LNLGQDITRWDKGTLLKFAIELRKESLRDVLAVDSIRIGNTNDLETNLASIIDDLKANQQAKNSFYKVYQKGAYPSHWHFNEENVSVIPDIIVNALPPTIFVNKKGYSIAGTHGYDAKGNDDLTAIFIAAGVSIYKDKKINAFENIHIFPFLSKLLSLESNVNVDGDFSVLSSILKPSVEK